jgi:hemerythrin superfamily protein
VDEPVLGLPLARNGISIVLQEQRCMASAKTTIDHQSIQQWVEERGGTPARVKDTGNDRQPGILRIDYPGFTGEDTLEPLEWDAFFEAFEANELAFLYQDEPNSRFSKFIARDNHQRGQQRDAIDLLESQHRDVERLFEQLREAGDKRERKRLFVQLADNLAAHGKIEELLFYPAVCTDQTAEQLHDAVDEHLDVKRAVAELMEMDVEDELFTDKLDELERLVGDHVEKEENRLFVQGREQEQVDLEELAAQLEEEFADLMQHQPRKQIPTELDGPAELPC